MLVDITERKRAEALANCQKQALEMLGEGAPLQDVLEFLIHMAERHIPGGMLGSILLLNDEGTHFPQGIGPSLPQEFNAAVAGIAVSSGLGVCCDAVARREPVVVPDFSADPKWARFVEFLAPYGLRAGWSSPIIGANGKVLGTFANYYRHPCDPTPCDLRWVEIVKGTAAIAIERRRAEAATRESEERFRALVQASSDVVYRMSPDWSEMRHLVGRDFIADTDDPSRTWLDKYIHPDDQPLVTEVIDKAIRTKSTFELEHRVRRVDGSLGWTFSRAVPLLDAHGEITEWIGTATDVTDRKRMEALRTAQNHVLELAIQDTPLDETMDELVRMVEAQSQFGMLGSLLLLDRDGMHLRHCSSPSLPDAYNRAINGITIGPSAGSCGTAAYRKAPVYVSDIAADPLWADFRDLALSHDLRACWSTPILSGHGELLGTFAMYYREPRQPAPHDLELVNFVIRSASLVIERKRAEEALRRLNETLEQRVSDALAERKLWADIFETTNAIICVLSKDFRFLAVNRAYVGEFEHIHGIRPRVGDDLLALLADRPKHQAHARAIWERALAGEEFTTIEEFGEETRARSHYEITYSTLRDADGRMIGAFQYARDVTERLRNQAQLAATEERLRQAQRLEALGQLAGGIAHDFNNVLQAVSGGLSLIQRRAEDTEAVRRMARMAGEAAERGAAVTSRLLAFARRGELRAVPVPPLPLLENLREILTPTLGAEITVRIKVPPGLPPLLADKAQLETVLVNLAVNARDAMPNGGTLTISAQPESVSNGWAHRAGLSAGTYLRVDVTDTGVGMDEATLARASEPFFTTKPVGQGTGLGLAMARGFAQQSGGGFAIRSAPGQGTTVSLWFPRAQATDASACHETSSPPHTIAASVLVVDDNAMVREVLAGQLEALGYRITRAADGFAALARLDGGERPELLVTDLSMPGMNGLVLIEEARRRRPNLPALLITGYADSGIRLHLEETRDPRTILLRKPILDNELAQSAAVLLGMGATN
jgi:PAS domain S-box-containing protein